MPLGNPCTCLYHFHAPNSLLFRVDLFPKFTGSLKLNLKSTHSLKSSLILSQLEAISFSELPDIVPASASTWIFCLEPPFLLMRLITLARLRAGWEDSHKSRLCSKITKPRVLPLVGVLDYLDSFRHHCHLPKVSIAREVENCVSQNPSEMGDTSTNFRRKGSHYFLEAIAGGWLSVWEVLISFWWAFWESSASVLQPEGSEGNFQSFLIFRESLVQASWEPCGTTGRYHHWQLPLGREDLLEKEMVTVQCSCLENPMDRRACRALIHGVAKNQTWLND